MRPMKPMGPATATRGTDHGRGSEQDLQPQARKVDAPARRHLLARQEQVQLPAPENQEDRPGAAGGSQRTSR
jgi:hypothetical protein